jgi:hypothetical protein
MQIYRPAKGGGMALRRRLLPLLPVPVLVLVLLG